MYAEDPDAGFLPQIGRLHVLNWPSPEEGLRIDAGVEQGADISPFYDPMIAKVISHGATRDDAISNLASALSNTTILGLRSNLAFNERLITQEAFGAGTFDTSFIDQHLGALVRNELPGPAVIAACEAWLHMKMAGQDSDPWQKLAGWSFAGQTRRDWLHLTVNGIDTTVEIDWRGNERLYTVKAEDRTINASASSFSRSGDNISCLVDGQPVECRYTTVNADHRLLLTTMGCHLDVAAQDMLNRDEEAGQSSGIIKAPMSGKIISLLVEAGQAVAKGEQLAVLEAMKMEHSLTAGFAATVQSVGAGEGDQVTERPADHRSCRRRTGRLSRFASLSISLSFRRKVTLRLVRHSVTLPSLTTP